MGRGNPWCSQAKDAWSSSLDFNPSRALLTGCRLMPNCRRYPWLGSLQSIRGQAASNKATFYASETIGYRGKGSVLRAFSSINFGPLAVLGSRSILFQTAMHTWSHWICPIHDKDGQAFDGFLCNFLHPSSAHVGSQDSTCDRSILS